MLLPNRLALPIAAAIIALLLPIVVRADSCDADCEGENCTGGCEVSSLSCSVSCVDDGCPGTATCKEYGDNTECFHSFTSDCEEGISDEPPDGPITRDLVAPPIVASPEWAVLRYEERHLTPVRWNHVTAVAASSWHFSEQAVDQLVEATHREAERRVRSRSAGEIAEAPWTRPPTLRLHFVVSPKARCSDVTMELTTPAPEQPFGGPASLFARAAVDSEGRIAGAELLYSSAGEPQTDSMIRFLKQAARIRPTTGASGPLEAFVVLFTKTGRDVGWIVSGARPLL